MATAARAIELALMHGLDAYVVGATRTRRPTVAFALTPDELARAALEKVLARTPDEPSPTRIGALAQLAFIPPYEPDLATSKRLSAQAVALAERQTEWEPMFEALLRRGSFPWIELDRKEARDPDFALPPQERDERWRVIVRRPPEIDE